MKSKPKPTRATTSHARFENEKQDTLSVFLSRSPRLSRQGTTDGSQGRDAATRSTGHVLFTLLETGVCLHQKSRVRQPIAVCEIMSRHLHTTTPEMPIEEAAKVMCAEKIAALLVLSIIH